MKIRNITFLVLSLMILTHRGDAIGVAPMPIEDAPTTKSISDSAPAPPNDVAFQGIITDVRQLRDHDNCVRVGKDCDTLIVIHVTAISEGVPDFEIGQTVAFGVRSSTLWDYFFDKEIGFVLVSHRGRYLLLLPFGC